MCYQSFRLKLNNCMKMEDIDVEIKQVAAAKRTELEMKFLQVRLKRCEAGIPINKQWVSTWRKFISKSVAQAVEKHLSRRDALYATRYKQPAAPASTVHASQVAQAQKPAVEGSKHY